MNISNDIEIVDKFTPEEVEKMKNNFSAGWVVMSKGVLLVRTITGNLIVSGSIRGEAIKKPQIIRTLGKVLWVTKNPATDDVILIVEQGTERNQVFILDVYNLEVKEFEISGPKKVTEIYFGDHGTIAVCDQKVGYEIDDFDKEGFNIARHNPVEVVLEENDTWLSNQLNGIGKKVKDLREKSLFIDARGVAYISKTREATLKTIDTNVPIVDADTDGQSFVAISQRGEVWVWGRNDKGQLGDGTLIDREKAKESLAGVRIK